MQSNKRFTIVVLLFVVVFMAILLAVAVPIFSAVTKNAQKKTCAANVREIVSQISNHCMGGDDSGAVINETATFNIAVNATTKKAEVKLAEGSATPSKLSTTVVTDMFQEVPYCPVDGSVYTVKVVKGASTPTVDVECSIAGHGTVAETTTK
jgi:competence protein ComGC